MSNPDFVEPYPGYFKETNKGPVVVPVVGTMTAIAGLFAAARIYSRIISLGKLAVDDYIVILGVVSAAPGTPRVLKSGHVHQCC
jgi:hypothetical protein